MKRCLQTSEAADVDDQDFSAVSGREGRAASSWLPDRLIRDATSCKKSISRSYID